MCYLLRLLARHPPTLPQTSFLNFISSIQHSQLQKHTADDCFLTSLVSVHFYTTLQGTDFEMQETQFYSHIVKILTSCVHLCTCLCGPECACVSLWVDTWVCASARASVKVLWLRMSKVAAHAAIRGDGRVCESVCMWCDPDRSEGVFNRGAETDGTHSLQQDRLTHLKSSSSCLSIPLNQTFFCTSFLTMCPTAHKHKASTINSFSQDTRPQAVAQALYHFVFYWKKAL